MIDVCLSSRESSLRRMHDAQAFFSGISRAIVMAIACAALLQNCYYIARWKNIAMKCHLVRARRQLNGLLG